MNFDVSWFLTIPGMLITGGVFLLIIALIIFIATSKKKGKKENLDSKPEAQMTSDAQAVSNEPVNASINENINNTTVPEVGVQEPVTMGGITDIPPVIGDETLRTVPEVSPEAVSNMMPPSGTENITTGVATNTIPNNDPIVPTVELSTQQTSPAYYASPVVENNVETPVVAPTTPVAPIPPVTPAAPSEGVAIYGGANPSALNMDIPKNETHQIYGGANPLENTQTFKPIVDTQPVAQPQTPVVEPTPVVPIVQPTNVQTPVMPTVTPTAQPTQTETTNTVEVLNI